MESHKIWQTIAIMIGLILLSGYFSATETAFTSLNRIRMKNMADDGDKRAKRVIDLERDYDDLLYTILIGNNLVNIATTAVATVFFVSLYGDYGATIATAVTTVIVLIFGEITPKSLAKEHSESFAIHSAPFIYALKLTFTPFNWVFRMWRKMISKVFKTKGSDGITDDELITIVEEAEFEGHIDSDKSMLVQNAISFSDLESWDVLTPRVEVEAVDKSSEIEEIHRTFLKTGFSRLPVYDEDLDKIIGILNIKDFYNYALSGAKSVEELVKPAVYVAGSMKVRELLKILQKNRCKMAIVVDEYGGTAGLITAEDIVQELVGEISDDSDTVASREITLLQNGSYRVLGGGNLEKMFDYFDEEVEINATTVNGWVVIQLDRLPKEGDKFEYRVGNKLFKVRVTKADKRKATEINLQVVEIPEDSEVI